MFVSSIPESQPFANAGTTSIPILYYAQYDIV